MSGINILCAKGPTATWALVERVYNAIKALEDGCTTTDLVAVLDPPADLAAVSSAVSNLVLAKDAPVTSARSNGGRHEQLRVVAPLPDVLYRREDRPRRVHSGKNSIKLAAMSREELLRLKMEVNLRLAGLK